VVRVAQCPLRAHRNTRHDVAHGNAITPPPSIHRTSVVQRAVRQAVQQVVQQSHETRKLIQRQIHNVLTCQDVVQLVVRLVVHEDRNRSK